MMSLIFANCRSFFKSRLELVFNDSNKTLDELPCMKEMQYMRILVWLLELRGHIGVEWKVDTYMFCMSLTRTGVT
jgi:hypothetical protein